MLYSTRSDIIYVALTEIRSRIEALEDDALLQMVALDEGDYREDVLNVARKEIARRSLRPMTATEYLESLPRERFEGQPLFCIRCREATTNDPAPPLTRHGNVSVGVQLMDREDPCNTCGSVVRHLYFKFLLPVTRLSSYRVKEVHPIWPAAPRILASRKIRET